MVVYGGALEETLFDATALPRLVIEALNDDRQTLDKEYTAEDGNEEFLADDDCTHGDDAANGETTCVAHEDLGREGIVPQESDECPDEGT